MASRVAWKVFRLRRDGTLGSLFVDRGTVLPVGKWLEARGDLPHPGLAHRPGWHCCSERRAPHLRMRLANGERRVWARVEVGGSVREDRRPASQGGLWLLAPRIRILEVIHEGEDDGAGAPRP